MMEKKWTRTLSLSGWLLLESNGCWKIDSIPPELSAILQEIEKAIEAKLYYLAIAVALSVPDICASLEFDPDKPSWSSEKTYIAWCDANIGADFKNLSGVDLYRLRGGVLHRGNFDHPKSNFDRVMFIGPESQIRAHDIVVTVMPGVTFGGISAEALRISGKILQLDVLQFCKTITDASRRWVVSKTGDTHVKRNLPNLVRYRPNGLPPFSIGVPTVA